MALDTQVVKFLNQLEANPLDISAVIQLEKMFSPDWEGLVELFEERGKSSHDGMAARFFLEAGRIVQSKLQNEARATGFYELAELSSLNAGLVHEIKLLQLSHAGQAELFSYFTDVLNDWPHTDTSEAGILETQRQQSVLYYRVATILRDVLKNNEDAEGAYAYALQLDPSNLAAFWARQSLAETDGRWEDYAALLIAEYQMLTGAETDIERQLEILLDLGDVYHQHLDLSEDAAHSYRNVYEYDPTNERARKGLVSLGHLPPLDGEDEESQVLELEEVVADSAELPTGVKHISEADSVGEDAQGFALGSTSKMGGMGIAAPIADSLADGSELDLELSDLKEDSEEPNSQRITIEPEEPNGQRATITPDEYDDPDSSDANGMTVPPSAEAFELRKSETVDLLPMDSIEPIDASESEIEVGVLSEAIEVGQPVELSEAEHSEDEKVETEESEAEESEALALDSVAENADANEAESEIAAKAEREESVAEESVAEESVAEESVAEESVAAESVAEESAVEESVAEASAAEVDPVPERVDLSPTAGKWTERVESCCESEALDTLVNGVRIADRNRGMKEYYELLWHAASGTSELEAFYDQTHFLHDDKAFWEDAFDGAGGNVQAKIAFISLQDEARTKEVGGDFAEELVGDGAAARDNWRKFQRLVETRFAGLEGDEKERRIYFHMADIAVAIQADDKEMDSMRRLDRAVKNDPVVGSRLKRIYRDAEKWPGVVEVIKKELAAAVDPEDKIDILREQVSVYKNHMKNNNHVVSAYKEILKLDETNDEALEALMELYEQMNKSSDLVAILKQKAESSEDNDEKIAIHMRIATIFVEKFRNQAEALKSYEQVLEFDPKHRMACESLIEIYEKRREWDKLIDLKRRLLEGLSDEEKISGTKEIAELASKNRKSVLATELWIAVREYSPTDIDALDALEKEYGKTKDYSALAGIIEDKAAITEDPDEKLKLLQKLGLLYSDRIGDQEKASIAWQSAYEIDPTNLKSKKSLEKLYIDGQRWDELESFYDESSNPKDLVRLLSSLSGKAKDPASKIELLTRSARVVKDKLGDPARAEKDLEKVLELDPRNAFAALELEPIYLENAAYQKLNSVYEIILESLTEPTERLDYMEKLGALNGEHLDSTHGAFRWYSKALRELPGQESLYPKVEGAAQASDLFEALVDTYRDVLKSVDDDSELTQKVSLRLGRVLSKELNNTDSAIEVYDSVLSVDPNQGEALTAVADIYERTQRWDDLMKVYEHRIALAEAPEERVEILRGMAVIAEEQAGDVPQAISRHLEALEIDENYQPCLAQLHRLYKETGAFEEMVSIIAREIALIEEAADARESKAKAVDFKGLLPGEDTGEALENSFESAACYTDDELDKLIVLHLELGSISKSELNDSETAVASLAKVLNWSPRNQTALAEIESYLEDGTQKVKVAEALDYVYELQGNWSAYVNTLEIQRDAVSGDSEKIRFEKMIAKAYMEEIGDPESAFMSYGKWVQLDPKSDARQEAFRIADALKDWVPLVELYEDVLPNIEDDDTKLIYLYELADVYSEDLDQPEKARDALERILELRGTETRALDELEQLFTKTGQWQSLLEVLQRKLETTDSPDSIESLRLGSALLWEEKLDNRMEAISIFEEIRGSNSGNLNAIESLNRLYIVEERWSDLASSLELQLKVVPETIHSDIKNQLAGVRNEKLKEPELAVDLYEEILEKDSGNTDALTSLEKMMFDEDGPQSRVATILEPFYEGQDNWEKLIEALEVRASSATEPEESVSFLHRIADLHEYRAHRSDLAFRTFGRAMRYAPQDEKTIDNLYRIAGTQNDYLALVQTFEDESERQDTPAIKRDLLRRSAAIYRDTLQDSENSSKRLNEVLELFPDDMESVIELETIHRQSQNWEPLVEVLLTKSELVEDVDEKTNLLHQAGTMYEEFLSDTSSAIDAYTRVLDIKPDDLAAIDRVANLYAETDQWENLLTIYDRKVSLAEDDETKKELFFAIGGIHSEALEQPHDAIDTYRRVLDLDDEDVKALGHLDVLYAQTEQWSELSEVLKKQMDLATDPSSILALKFRLGQLAEQKLYDVPGAIEIYKEILEFDAFHEEAQAALASIIETGDDALAASEVLEPVYLQAGRWEELIRVYELQIGSTDDSARKVELYSQIGSTQEMKRLDKGAAFQAYAQAVQCDSSNVQTLDTLERLAQELGGWDILIEILDGELDEATDAQTIRMLNVRIARIQEEELYNSISAIDRFRRVLDIEPDDEQAVLALDRLYQQEGEWAPLTQILETRVMNAEPEARLPLQLRLGRVYQTALEKPDEALAIYRDILSDDAENIDAISALEEMFMAGQAVNETAGILEPFYTSRNEHGKLIEIYLQRLQQLDEPEDKYDVWILIANTFLNELEDEEGALGAYANALVEKPSDEATLQKIMDLSESTGLWQDTAEHLKRALDSPLAEEEASAKLHNSRGLVFEKHLGQIDQAEFSYLQSLRFEEANIPALSALDRIYDQQGQYPDLANILTKRIAQTFEEEELIDLHFRLGGLYQNQLAQLDDAVQTYNAVLDVDPSYQPALATLEQIHHQRSDWPELFEVLERQTSILEDADERATKFGFMAQIAEQALERKDDAIDLYGRVLEMRPDDLEALQQLHRLYIEEERWSDLVEVLTQEVELTQDPQGKLGLYESLGTVWSEHLGNESQAMESWQKVLEIDAFNNRALEALLVIYEREGDYVELSEILSRMLQLDSLEPTRLQELWAKQGEIQGDMLMQPDASIESWRQVLAYDPRNVPALENLERQYLAGERWEEAAQILEMKAETVDDAEGRLELLGRIANIWEERVLNQERAAYFYEQMLEIDAVNPNAGGSLESIYKAQADPTSFQKLATLYLDRSEQNAGDPIGFLESRRASARVFEENLQEPQSAFLVLLSAFSATTTDDTELVNDLERLASDTGNWSELVKHFENVLNDVTGSDAFDLHRQVGSWQSDKLGQKDEAIYHFQRALAIEPDSLETMENLEVLYRDLNEWSELGRILHARVDLSTDPDDQVSLWRRLGELYELQLQDVDQAVSSYKRIIEIDASDILAIESLERIYGTTEKWSDLIEVLATKAENTYDAEEQVSIGFQSAKIWEDRVGDIDKAVSAYESVLAIDQTHVESLSELERIFTNNQKWDGLADVYEQQLNLTSDPHLQAQIYNRQAALFEGPFEDVDRAVDSFNSILMIDPEHSETLANLKRLYFDNERWFDLVEVMQKQGEIADKTDPQTASSTWNELASIQRTQISDPNTAIDSYRRSVDGDPNQIQVWSELASLYQEVADWNSAVDCYRQLSQLTSGDDKVNSFYQMGFLYESNLQDDQQAEENYERALDLQASHQPALLALRDLYKRRSDWKSTLRILKQAEETSKDLGEKAAFLCEIGKTYDQELSDPVSALHYYQSALENDPNSVEAAEPLIDLYVSEKRWERAAPLLNRFLENVEGRDRETQHRRFVQHATVCRELGQDDDALNALRSAYELDANDTETLMALGNILFKKGEWEQSFQIFQTLQFNHTEALTNDQLVEVYFKSAEIKSEVGEQRRAIQLYQKALEFDPNFSPAVEKLMVSYEAEGNWEQVITYSHSKLESETDEKIRFSELVKVGDIWLEKLNRPNNASEVYHQALEVEPNSVAILRKLLDIYTKGSQWSDAIEMLRRLISLEESSAKRGKYFYTIAVISRDKIRDAAQAVAAFEETLDTDPKMLKSFEAIDRILTETKQWKELERAYRRMIRRVTQHDDGTMEEIKLLLWTNLGEIYRSRLNLVKSAIGAYEAAVNLDPKSEKLRLILAELYESKSDNKAGAIEHHKAMISNNPFRIDSYRALWKAYMMQKEYDKAWCMAGALSFLGKANSQEDKFYQQYLGQSVKRTKRTINQDALKLLYHGPQDIVLMSMIVGILGQGLRHKYSRPLKEKGVHKKKDKLDVNEKLIFCQVYSYVSQVCGMLPAPALYLKQEHALGILNANSDPPAFIIGGDMMAQKTDRELTFLTAKKLAWARPEHYLGSIGYPTDFVKILFMAAMAVADPSLGIQNSLGQGAEWISEIQKMQPQFKMQLMKRMQSYLSLGGNPNLSKWMTHADHTSNRFGLLLCGDLTQAAACVKSDNAPVGKATVKEKISELVLFSISDEYFQLREMLGLSIGAQ